MLVVVVEHYKNCLNEQGCFFLACIFFLCSLLFVCWSKRRCHITHVCVWAVVVVGDLRGQHKPPAVPFALNVVIKEVHIQGRLH